MGAQLCSNLRNGIFRRKAAFLLYMAALSSSPQSTSSTNSADETSAVTEASQSLSYSLFHTAANMYKKDEKSEEMSGAWIGMRRTLLSCRAYAASKSGESIVAARYDVLE